MFRHARARGLVRAAWPSEAWLGTPRKGRRRAGNGTRKLASGQKKCGAGREPAPAQEVREATGPKRVKWHGSGGSEEEAGQGGGEEERGGEGPAEGDAEGLARRGGAGCVGRGGRGVGPTGALVLGGGTGTGWGDEIGEHGRPPFRVASELDEAFAIAYYCLIGQSIAIVNKFRQSGYFAFLCH